MAQPVTGPKLLEVRQLVTGFETRSGWVHAVDGISFSLESGKTLGIVGESGCGKSVTSLSLMRLIPKPGKILSGEVLYKGSNLLKWDEEKMRSLRGNEMAMVFQEPMTSLNPVFTVGAQVMESLEIHRGLSKREARQRAIELFQLVKIPSPEKRVDEYPHQLSGGMRQRVMIAMALACKPQVLICDEPTTALDVTIQAQILDLMRSLREQMGMAMILITHDLGVVAENCDEVMVMYAGRVVEQGPVAAVFRNPQHPYTKGLMGSLPQLTTPESKAGGRKRLVAIPGMVPSLTALPQGCRFQDRCQFVQDRCRSSQPPLVSVGEQQVACFLDAASLANKERM